MYKEVVKNAVGAAAGVIHQVDSPIGMCLPAGPYFADDDVK